MTKGIFLGSTEITPSDSFSAVYFGSTKIWPAASATLPEYIAACDPVAGNTSPQFTLPGSAQAGDTLFMSWTAATGFKTFTPPSGSTTFVNGDAGGSPVPFYVGVYTLTAADITAGTVAFATTDANGVTHGEVLRNIRVADTSLLTNGPTGLQGNPCVMTADGVTTTAPNDMLLVVYRPKPNGSITALAGPDGWSAGAALSVATFTALTTYYTTQAAAGATGDVVGTYSTTGASNNDYAAMLVALKVVAPRITLSATFPSNLHVGDTVNFDVTATEVDGATGTLNITVDQLPAGLSLSTTTDNGDGTFTATVSGTLTTEQTVTASFGATGGSVAATALTHEFNVQAAAAGNPTFVQGNALSLYGGGGKASLTIPLPGVATNGDQLAAILVSSDASTAIPSGWTPVVAFAGQALHGGTVYCAIVKRTSNGTETGITITRPAGGFGYLSAAIAQFHGGKVGTVTTGYHANGDTVLPFGPSDSPIGANSIPLLLMAMSGTPALGGAFNGSWTGYASGRGTGDTTYNNAVYSYLSTPPNAVVSGAINEAHVTGDAGNNWWATLWIDPA